MSCEKSDSFSGNIISHQKRKNMTFAKSSFYMASNLYWTYKLHICRAGFTNRLCRLNSIQRPRRNKGLITPKRDRRGYVTSFFRDNYDTSHSSPAANVKLKLPRAFHFLNPALHVNLKKCLFFLVFFNDKAE